MDPVSITALTAYAGTLVGPLLEWSGKLGASAAKSAADEALAHLTKEPRRRIAEKLMLWLSEGKLPPDDPLARASRMALAQALSWMAAGMESEPDAETRAEIGWRVKRGLPVEAVQFLTPERRAWIKSLRSLLRDEERLIELERRRLEREDLERLLQTSTHQASADELHRRTRDWLDRHLGKVGAPTEQLDNFLDKGWPLPGRPQRMTLYQAWCAWFGHNVKRQPELFNSFVTAALAEVVQRLPPREDAAQTFSACLEEPLGQLRHIVDRILPLTEAIDYRTREMFSMLQEMQERGVPPRASARDSDATSTFWNDELDAAQQALLDALVSESATAAVAEATIEAVIEAEPKGLRGWLLQRYARASRSQGTASLYAKGEVWLDADFIAPQLQVHPKDKDTPALRFDALTELLLQPSPTAAWLIVGDAGGGKTTLLRHHEMVQARDLLRRLARPTGESLAGARLCIRLRLSTYRREGSGADLHWPDCEHWLQAQWARQASPGVLPSLEVMRRSFRLRFLLDGVNEIEAEASAAVRQQAMRRFAAWVDTQGRAQPAPVFTVRRHDLGTALSGLRKAREIHLGRWSAEHVERFCRRDGVDVHEALWQRLKSDPHLMGLCQVPFNLVAQRALSDKGYLAGSRAELFLGLLWLSLKRAMHKGDLMQPGLLSSPDLNKLADDEYWKGARSRRMLPMEGTLLRGLAQQARDMAPALDIAYAKAAQFDKADQFAGWSARDRQCWLEAVQALGLAEVRMGDGEFFAFAHQLWQEFFLACAWSAQGDVPVAVADWAARASRPDEMNLAETLKFVAQLAEQPEALIERLASGNLALAGRAAANCLSRLPAERLAQLRQGLLARSRDPNVALAERVDAAEALGLMGDDVRYERLGGGATSAYLLPRRSAGIGSGTGWIRVPGGTHSLGSRRRPPEVEAIDCGPGGEPMQVELAPFELAFAPVTNAEFALFVQAGGYEDTRWWPDAASARWLRGELRDEAGLAWQMRRHAALIEDFEGGMDLFFNRRTAANLDFARSILVLSAAEAKARFESIYPMSGQPPAFMDVPEFANPLQPVVGVSAFEAEAYCRWLSAQSGLHIRLPTEAEWDAAARGAHARAWPWGDDESRSGHFNSEAVGLGRTSPVGVFPGSDTPEGAVDMAGNVWEWSRSAYTPEGIGASAARRAPKPGMLRAIRGGCHQFEPNECRPDYRFKSNPLMRNKIIGFRLVCDPAAPGITPRARVL